MRSTTSSVLLCVVAILSACYALLWRWVDFAMPAEINPMLFGVPLVLNVARSVPTARTVLVVGVLGALAYSVIRFLLWNRARGGSGSALLLAAALLGLIPLLAQLSAVSALRLGVPISWLVQVESFAASYGWLVQPLALLLFALGLLRAKFIPLWMAVVGIAAAVVLAAAVPPGGDPLDWLRPSALSGNSAAYLVGFALETAFLIALGLSIVFRELRSDPVAQ